MAKKPIPNDPSKTNWVERAGGLPQYIRRIAEHLHGQGMSVSRSIAVAVNTVKRWARGGPARKGGPGHVTAKTMAEAAAAVADWERKKAMSGGGMPSDFYEYYDRLSEEENVDDDLYDALTAAAESWNQEGERTVYADGLYEEIVDDASDIEEAMTAGAAPVRPPKSWFDDPKLSELTPLTIDGDGRVFGHIASWNVDHIGLPGSRKPPRSKSNYAFFRTGVVETDDGDQVPVGQITYTGGHAPLQATAEATVRHYDDTDSAIADVTVGEDMWGPWVAGALRPGVTEGQIRAVRASAPSGDWRPINGNLELVAVCQVNVPGFPVARSLVAGGEIMSLVAAGAGPLYQLRQESAVLTSLQVMNDRIASLEEEVSSERRAALTASIDGDDGVDDDGSPGMSPIERIECRLQEAKRRHLEARVASLRNR